MKLKLLLFILGFSFLSNVRAQDSTYPIELADSCVYMGESYFGCEHVFCIPNCHSMVINCPIDDYKLMVYNPWGELLFETTDPAESWNSYGMREGEYSWYITGLKTESATPFAVFKWGTVLIYY